MGGILLWQTFLALFSGSLRGVIRQACLRRVTSLPWPTKTALVVDVSHCDSKPLMFNRIYIKLLYLWVLGKKCNRFPICVAHFLSVSRLLTPVDAAQEVDKQTTTLTFLADVALKIKWRESWTYQITLKCQQRSYIVNGMPSPPTWSRLVGYKMLSFSKRKEVNMDPGGIPFLNEGFWWLVNQKKAEVISFPRLVRSSKSRMPLSRFKLWLAAVALWIPTALLLCFTKN